MRDIARLLVVCLVSCADASMQPHEGADQSNTQQPVIGGTPTSGISAVGMLVYPMGGNEYEFCTGTLVAQNKVLTAGHCVLPDRAQGVSSWDTTRFTFYLGETPLQSATAQVTSTHVETPAAFAQYAPDFDVSSVPESFSDADMAVITLGTSLQVSPIGWTTALPGAGTPVTLVGYGLTNAANDNTYGTKNFVTTTLLGLDQDAGLAHWGDATHTTCHGDSGSPVLQTVNGAYQIVATVSTGNCAGPGNGPSTAAQSTWLQSVIKGAPSAPAPPQPGLIAGTHYRILSLSTGGSLDVNASSTDNGTLIQQWSYWGGANQQWYVIPLSDGTFEIANVNSNACLSVLNASNDDGGRIQQWQCFGGVNQKWRLQQLSGGAYQIIGNASNKCLDLQNNSTANGAIIQQWDCWGGANQAWTFTAL